MSRKSLLGRFLNQTRIIVLSFLTMILVGAVLLVLPVSGRERLSFVDALFVATSATCVTGLSTVDVSGVLTGFGQAVVLILVQFGGLGFMTWASATFVMFGKRFTLREKLNMRDYLSESDMSGLNKLALNVIKFTAIIEGAGALLLTIAFSFDFSFGRALWYGVFHSITSFCNAGLDILPGDGSFAAYAGNPFVLIVIALLVTAGGLGFIAIGDLVKTRNPKKLRVESKIIFSVGGVLLLLGTIVYMVCEYNNPLTLGNLGFFDKLCNAFFLSASTRTAGFASFPMEAMTPVARNLTMVLMFIGAAPGSTAGGIKTTTLFVLLVWIVAHIRNRKIAVIDLRKVGNEVKSKAATILVLAFVVITLAQTVLLGLDGANFTFEQLLFETVSAYATVGLTMGITTALSTGSKLVIILIMFMGRVGAYTLLVAAIKRNNTPDNIKYQEFNVMM